MEAANASALQARRSARMLSPRATQPCPLTAGPAADGAPGSGGGGAGSSLGREAEEQEGSEEQAAELMQRAAETVAVAEASLEVLREMEVGACKAVARTCMHQRW